MASTSFQMLMDAYIRGFHWALENGVAANGIHKAAYDYADKNTSPGTLLDMLANQAAHVRLGMKTRQDVTEATKILIDMVEEFVDGKAE